MNFLNEKLKCKRCLERFREEEDILLSHFDWEIICRKCLIIEKQHMFYKEAVETSLNSFHKSDLFGVPTDWDEFFEKNRNIKMNSISKSVSSTEHENKEIKRKLPSDHPFYEISDVIE